MLIARYPFSDFERGNEESDTLEILTQDNLQQCFQQWKIRTWRFIDRGEAEGVENFHQSRYLISTSQTIETIQLRFN